MLRLQNLRQMRVVGLHQRPRLQACAIEGHPEGDHRHRYGHIFENSPAEMKIAGSILEVRLNEPEQIECLGKNHPLAHPDQTLLVALDVARQEQSEGNEPVEDEI